VTILRKKFSPPARPCLHGYKPHSSDEATTVWVAIPGGSNIRFAAPLGEDESATLLQHLTERQLEGAPCPSGHSTLLFSILSLVRLRETSSRFADRGVHCCAAAGKDANVSARPKAAERPVPARRFNLAMEILILESPLRFVLYPLGPWKSQPTYTAGSAVSQQLCILRQSFDAPCSIVATPLLATLARALPGAAVGPFPAFIQLRAAWCMNSSWTAIGCRLTYGMAA
jgi:hypothetical protein